MPTTQDTTSRPSRIGRLQEDGSRLLDWSNGAQPPEPGDTLMLGDGTVVRCLSRGATRVRGKARPVVVHEHPPCPAPRCDGTLSFSRTGWQCDRCARYPDGAP